MVAREAMSQSPLERRINEVRRMFDSTAARYDTTFSEYFLSQVPAAQLSMGFSHFRTNYGKVQEVTLDTQHSAFAAKYRFILEKGYAVPVTMSITATAPHRIEGLLLGQPSKLAVSLEDVVAELKKLPGLTSLYITKDQQPLVKHNESQWLAIGSAFKLYVLRALMEEIATGKRSWSDVVRLTERSLPSGSLHKWPPGSPITLHTLATLMISISDNTATDQLMAVLGPEVLEAPFALSSHSDAQKNIPFLTTREMFKLKAFADLRERFVNAPPGARRKLLEGDARIVSLETMPSSDVPMHIDTLEWFASTQQLSGLMTQIVDLASKNNEAGRGLEVLGINPGLTISDKKWGRVAFKGGSEPGVLNLSYALKSKTGEWYTLIATWNNPKASLREDEFVALVQRAIELL